MSIFTKIGAWFKRALHNTKDVFVPIAVTITEFVKKEEDNGVLDSIAEAIDMATGTHISTQANAAIKLAIPKALAVELAIEGLPANPTEDDIKAFETNIITAVAGKDAAAKSKFYTNFAEDVYSIVHNEVTGQTTPLTFAEIVDIVNKAYKAYKAESVTTTAPLIGRAAVTEESMHGGISVADLAP